MTALTLPMPGLHKDVPEAVYAQWQALRTSHLKNALKSWRHFRHAETTPSEDTDALILGRAAHCAAFEPARYAADFVVYKKIDGRTKEGKEQAEQIKAETRTVLTEDEAGEIAQWCKALREHQQAGKIMAMPGDSEVSFVWSDEKTGVLCKGRIDRLIRRKGGLLIVDLKTAESAQPDRFAKDAIKYGYGIQAAQYVDGLRAATGEANIGFVWVVVEKKAPYVVEVYSATDPDTQPDFLTNGRVLRDRLLRELVECRNTGVYPSYTDGSRITPLRVPAYAIEQEPTE